MAVDLTVVAGAYADRHPGAPGIAAGFRLDLDEDYCREVAACYERAPRLAGSALRAYELLKAENLAQFRLIGEAGIDVRPWDGAGQPYRSSAELIERVLGTGVLLVHLTSVRHGPGPATGFHPMLAPSGISAHGVALCCNDLFRAVHDVFGHVMSGNHFGPRGEFRATFAHLGMYRREVHRVLLTEQIGQICWFYYGPHLLGRDGQPRRRGDPAYVPPPRRPYPEQKVFELSQSHLDRFEGLFHRLEAV
ncbi:crotonobetainyl-CoA--carnitine CoA-transferase [Amycolatopsis sp. NBC_00345]|uniref:crotonobetainyl-CoA--carnitine CoA-transferase n=1 Tax=Amycolatopsis sp. NBC_00345 TaxID=2975955 RepID=UPI002E25F9CE